MMGFNLINPFDNIAIGTRLLNLDAAWVVVKWVLVLGLAVYTIVAAIIIKQVAIMAQTLDDPANGVVRWFAKAHFLAALGLTLLMILIG